MDDVNIDHAFAQLGPSARLTHRPAAPSCERVRGHHTYVRTHVRAGVSLINARFSLSRKNSVDARALARHALVRRAQVPRALVHRTSACFTYSERYVFVAIVCVRGYNYTQGIINYLCLPALSSHVREPRGK